jgi:hypothetical protein
MIVGCGPKTTRNEIGYKICVLVSVNQKVEHGNLL